MKKFMKKYEEFASRYNSKDYLILRIPSDESYEADNVSKRVLKSISTRTYRVDDTYAGIHAVCESVRDNFTKAIKNPNLNTYLITFFADLCTAYNLESITKHGYIVHSMGYIKRGSWDLCPKLIYYSVQNKEICSLEPFPEYPEKNGYVLGIAGKPGTSIFDKVYEVFDSYFANSYYGSIKYDIEEVDHPDLDKRFTYFKLTKN